MAGALGGLASGASAGFQSRTICFGQLQMYHDDCPPDAQALPALPPLPDNGQ